MKKKLTRTGNSYAVVLDRPILEAVGLGPEDPVEVSTDGEVIVITPARDPARTKRIRKIMDEAHRTYGEVFQRLAK